ncbi:hypothetical protein [Phaeobacter sp. J2-8]|uniref:hypothetical protein n=1 Tax=Phaeobacter sp. J2-8 TaxID=2931394 RepID=UPI001FD2E2FB|nr:hypothetical protein [Phaeobacter sp. J2-8]MCJ7872422.1 hypothetical protein [Phaeobacter sp. J2-8]
MNDAPKSDTKPTYPGGIDGMLEQMEGRREPLTFSRGNSCRRWTWISRPGLHR